MALGFEMLMLLAVFLFGFQPYVSRDVAVDFFRLTIVIFVTGKINIMREAILLYSQMSSG